MRIDVHPIRTCFPWASFGDYRPCKLRITPLAGCERVEGVLVDDGMKGVGTLRKEARPFRVYIRRGRTYEEAALQFQHVIDLGQRLLDIEI